MPPSKPAPSQPDPMDTLGPIHRLRPELVIIFRSWGKKNPLTKGQALEELKSKWIDESSRKGDESVECDALVMMLLVWVCRLATMIRISTLTVSGFIGLLYSLYMCAGSAFWLLHRMHLGFRTLKSMVFGMGNLQHVRSHGHYYLCCHDVTKVIC